MFGWEVVGVFVGIPALVLGLIALPIFGPTWGEALRSDRRGGSTHRGDDSGHSEHERD